MKQGYLQYKQNSYPKISNFTVILLLNYCSQIETNYSKNYLIFYASFSFLL
jgi:hypothetical protein